MRRSLIILFGYYLASLAATEAGIVLKTLSDLIHGSAGADVSPILHPLTFALAFVVAVMMFIPSGLVILLAEMAEWRAWYYYVGAGAISPVLMAGHQTPFPRLRSENDTILDNATFVFFFCGALAGLTYWWVAGRSAGGNQE